MPSNIQPLHTVEASVGSGGMFQANVTIPEGNHGVRVIIFQGTREVAERVAACWNAQLGVPTDRIPS